MGKIAGKFGAGFKKKAAIGAAVAIPGIALTAWLLANALDSDDPELIQAAYQAGPQPYIPPSKQVF